MKRYYKLILLFLAVILLFAALWVIAKQPAKNEEDEKTEEPEIVVRTLSEELTAMTLTNSEGTFSFAKDSGEWKSLFRNGEKTYGNTVVSLESMVKTTLATELIEENAASLYKYGLDNPTAVLTATGESGAKYFIKIGNSIVGQKYYFTADDKNVYTVSATEGGLFFVGMGAFVDLSLVETEIENISKVVISNGEVIAVEKRASVAADTKKADSLFSYGVTSPVTANASPTEVQTLFNKVASVGAKSFIPYPDAETVMINPERYFEVVTDKGSFKYYIGSEAPGGYYVQKHGESGVYVVDKSQLEFMDTTVFTVVDKHINIHYVSDVSSIDISSPEGGYNIVLGDNPSVNGKAIDSDAAKNFYQAVISLCYDGEMKEGEESSEAEVTVTLHTVTGDETTEFHNAGVIKYEVIKPGVSGLTIQRKYVDKLLKLAKEL